MIRQSQQTFHHAAVAEVVVTTILIHTRGHKSLLAKPKCANRILAPASPAASLVDLRHSLAH